MRAPGAQWCTQCFQRFEPETPTSLVPDQADADPDAASDPAAPGSSQTSIPRQVDSPTVELSSWDERYRAVAAEERDEAASAAEVEELMAQLTSPGPDLGSAAGLAKITQSPGGKVVVVVAGGAVLLGVALLVMWVFGAML